MHCKLQEVYVPMGEEHESHLSFMKIVNAGEKLIINKHEGNLQSRIVYWWGDGTVELGMNLEDGLENHYLVPKPTSLAFDTA